MVTLAPCFHSVTTMKNQPKNEPPTCQPAKLNVGATAAKLGISTRHLIRLAKDGKIPGLKKAGNGHNFDWREYPEIMKWLRKEVLTRQGKKKRAVKRNGRLSNAQRFARLVGRVENRVFDYLKPALEKPTSSEIEKLNKAARRLKHIYDRVNGRIMTVRVWSGRVSGE